MVEDGFAGSVGAPALVASGSGAGGGEDDAAFCGAERGEGSLDLC